MLSKNIKVNLELLESGFLCCENLVNARIFFDWCKYEGIALGKWRYDDVNPANNCYCVVTNIDNNGYILTRYPSGHLTKTDIVHSFKQVFEILPEDEIKSESEKTFPREMLLRGEKVWVYGVSKFSKLHYVYEHTNVTTTEHISFFAELPEPKKMRPKNHSEMGRWWLDCVRGGGYPAFKYSDGEIYLYPPSSVDYLLFDLVFCANYTGDDDKWAWIKLETEL